MTNIFISFQIKAQRVECQIRMKEEEPVTDITVK